MNWIACFAWSFLRSIKNCSRHPDDVWMDHVESFHLDAIQTRAKRSSSSISMAANNCLFLHNTTFYPPIPSNYSHPSWMIQRWWLWAIDISQLAWMACFVYGNWTWYSSFLTTILVFGWLGLVSLFSTHLELWKNAVVETTSYVYI